MKYIWKQPISGTGSYTVQGTPRTIGVDLDGSLCVWFEEGPIATFIVAWTGDPIPDSFQIIGTVTASLIYHLAVAQ